MENNETLMNIVKEYNDRKGRDLEDQLFYYLDYAVSDENFNERADLREYDAKERYRKVKRIFEKEDKDIIESNIYLRKCKRFFNDSKSDCIDLYLLHKNDNELKVSKEVVVEELLPIIDTPELQGLEIVNTYNKISKELDKMYQEIARLHIWNMIDNKKDSTDNLATVTLRKTGNNTGILVAAFLKPQKNNSNTIKVYTK